MRKAVFIVLLGFVILVSFGCVYYNTFYHAKQSFNRAESARKEKDARGKEIINRSEYTRARDKSAKVIENYPTSKYYDDALFVNGVSNFYLEDFNHADRRFRELLANYPESEHIREARLYLAKTKLKLEDMAEARTLFEKLFQDSKEKSVKAEAASALGEYYFENKDYLNARKFFDSIIDSLGDTEAKKTALLYNAEGYFNLFQFRKALGNYLEVLKLDPTKDEKYKALFQAGRTSYFLNDITGGRDYFYELADDPLYYDSLGSIKLQIAEGFELDSDLLLAEETYREVAVEFPTRPAGAIANYNLGLIYQYDYEDYQQAKEFYDKAKVRTAGEEIYQDALQRSTDIGKLEEYTDRVNLDSTATQAEVDSAAYTQYLLGELYLLQLDKPDSAYQEFMYIIDQFSGAEIAPKAKIAISQIVRNSYEDTLRSDSILRSILREYPHSDYIPDVIDLLGLAGTAADTGYPLWYFEKAERFAFDEDQIDSAVYYYKYVSDSFPFSKYSLKAEFASIWVVDEFAPPGDSSLYYAYTAFLDSFPRTTYASVANDKINIPKRAPRREVDNESGTPAPELGQDGVYSVETGKYNDEVPGGEDEDTISPEERAYIDPEGKTIQEVEQGPYRCDLEWEYPPSAYTTRFEGNLVFQIKLDAFGEIADHRLMTPSTSQELDIAVTEYILNCHWDTGWMEPEEYGTWFVYRYQVRLPAGL